MELFFKVLLWYLGIGIVLNQVIPFLVDLFETIQFYFINKRIQKYEKRHRIFITPQYFHNNIPAEINMYKVYPCRYVKYLRPYEGSKPLLF